MNKTSIVIVSPYSAEANNGNWRTAWRWQRLLQPHYPVRIVREWRAQDASANERVMLALHARRSAVAIRGWAEAHAKLAGCSGGKGLTVVLTGTDLYRDINTDRQARRSLDFADQLVVLQERGALALPVELRDKARVIFQSTSARQTLHKTSLHLRAVMVGHLRAVKGPETFFAVARLLADRHDILLDHIGDGDEGGGSKGVGSSLADIARRTAAECPGYRWLGGLGHEETRRRIQRAHLLVHPSQMEGGAHVVMEAVRSGTPVLASAIDGNIGMLGEDYAGYFDFGDASALAKLLLRCRGKAQSDPLAKPNDPLYATLQAQCAARAPLFSAEREQAALLNLVKTLTTEP